VARCGRKRRSKGGIGTRDRKRYARRTKQTDFYYVSDLANRKKAAHFEPPLPKVESSSTPVQHARHALQGHGLRSTKQVCRLSLRRVRYGRHSSSPAMPPLTCSCRELLHHETIPQAASPIQLFLCRSNNPH